jgi:hypothetical protein
MKKKLFTLLFAIALILSLHVTFDAQATTCSNTFPISYNNYASGNCIPSSWANTLENILGLWGATSTSNTIFQELRGLATSSIFSNSSTITTLYDGNGNKYVTSTPFANPSALIGPTAINGTATTSMRSDAAPALNTSASYTQAGTWTFNGPTVFNASNTYPYTSTLALFDPQGNVRGYNPVSAGCNPNAFMSAFSASGTITCSQLVLNASSGISIATSGFVLSIQNTGVTTFNGATTTINFNNVAGNGISISNSKSGGNTTSTISIKGPGSYLGLDGSSQLTASTTLASSSLTFTFFSATTTKPQSFLSVITNTQKTIQNIDCWEYDTATTTIEVYYNTTLASSGIQQVILPALICGNAGVTTSTFTTSTLPANAYLFAIVSSTVGNPSSTYVDIFAQKQ